MTCLSCSLIMFIKMIRFISLRPEKWIYNTCTGRNWITGLIPVDHEQIKRWDQAQCWQCQQTNVSKFKAASRPLNSNNYFRKENDCYHGVPTMSMSMATTNQWSPNSQTAKRHHPPALIHITVTGHFNSTPFSEKNQVF